MGFFNKLLKNTSKKDLLNAVDMIADFVSETAKEAANSAKKPQETIPSFTSSRSDSWEDCSLHRTRAELLNDFKEMIMKNFPDYDIHYNYSAKELDSFCHPACTPIDFLFQKNGKSVLAVVIVRQNTYRGMNVIGTKKICDNLGIPYLRFFEEYPNKEEYVVPRIQNNL